MGKKSKKQTAAEIQSQAPEQVAVLDPAPEPEEAPKPRKRKQKGIVTPFDEPVQAPEIPAAPLEADLSKGGAKLKDKPRSRKKKEPEAPKVEEKAPPSIEWILEGEESNGYSQDYLYCRWEDSEQRYRLTRREERFSGEIGFSAELASKPGTGKYDHFVKGEKGDPGGTKPHWYTRLMPALLACEEHLLASLNLPPTHEIPSNREDFIEYQGGLADGRREEVKQPQQAPQTAQDGEQKPKKPGRKPKNQAPIQSQGEDSPSKPESPAPSNGHSKVGKRTDGKLSMRDREKELIESTTKKSPISAEQIFGILASEYKGEFKSADALKGYINSSASWVKRNNSKVCGNAKVGWWVE
jgi:hypothetical protein